MSWYITSIKNYVNFKGRARRKEYWFFLLFNYIFAVALGLVDDLLGLKFSDNVGILSAIYSLFVYLPTLSLAFRRLHDINKSAWWLLIGLIPVIGWIWLIVYTCLEGTPGDNKYGSDPKAVV